MSKLLHSLLLALPLVAPLGIASAQSASTDTNAAAAGVPPSQPTLPPSTYVPPVDASANANTSTTVTTPAPAPAANTKPATESSSVKQDIKRGAKSAKSEIKRDSKEAWSDAKSATKETWSDVKSGTKRAWNGVKEGSREAKDKVKSTVKGDNKTSPAAVTDARASANTSANTVAGTPSSSDPKQ